MQTCYCCEEDAAAKSAATRSKSSSPSLSCLLAPSSVRSEQWQTYFTFQIESPNRALKWSLEKLPYLGSYKGHNSQCDSTSLPSAKKACQYIYITGTITPTEASYGATRANDWTLLVLLFWSACVPELLVLLLLNSLNVWFLFFSLVCTYTNGSAQSLRISPQHILIVTNCPIPQITKRHNASIFSSEESQICKRLQ